MKTYINQEKANDFALWLIHKLNRIPQLEVYYDSRNRNDLESLWIDSYPFTIRAAYKINGKMIPEIKAVFILEQVGGRLKVGIKSHKSLAGCLLPVLREMVEDFPETAKDLQPEITRVECELSQGALATSHMKGKSGVHRFSDQEKLQAVYDWDKLDRTIYPVTLEEWLNNRFGNEAGIPNVAKSTFYSWKKLKKR